MTDLLGDICMYTHMCMSICIHTSVCVCGPIYFCVGKHSSSCSAHQPPYWPEFTVA